MAGLGLRPPVDAPARPRAGAFGWLAARPTGVVAVASGSMTFAWLVAAMLRYRFYHASAMDFGFFDQVVWNTSRGRPFATSFTPYNFLGQHFEPVLLLFAGLYRLTPRPEWLLLVQELAYGGAALALYALARRRLERPWLAALVAAAFLLSPSLSDALFFDYHSEVLAPLLVFAGLAALLGGRRRAGLALLLSTLLLKEDAALILIGLAVPLWLWRERRLARLLAVVGVAWVVLVVGLLMPALRGGDSDLEARYAYLGEGVGAGGIAGGLLRHPVRAAEHAVSRPALDGAIFALAPLGGLALLAPGWAVAALPDALLQFLSTHRTQQQLRLQYGVEVLPLLLVATVEGLRRVERVARERSRPRLISAAALLLGASVLVSAAWYSPLRWGDEVRTRDPQHRAAIADALRQIPPDAAVSAQSGLAPHLSHRQLIWEFPRLGSAEYVVVDLDGVVARPDVAGFSQAVAALPSEGYRLIWAERGLRVYRRG